MSPLFLILSSAELQFLGDELFYEVSYETLKLTAFFLKQKI